MKIKMYDYIYIDMLDHPIAKLGYCKRRVAFNKKKKMKYTKCLSNEYHNFKHKGSDKE
jgi:hypothetical protein